MTLRELLDAATLPEDGLARWTWGERTKYLTAAARLEALAPEMAALLLDTADALLWVCDHDLSDLSDAAWKWHGMHNSNGEQEAGGCVICTMRALLARLDRIDGGSS